MSPILSIIVPVYNVELYVKVCIDSILNQSFTNFELILVDDGSQDNSGRICDEYAEKDNRIKVIHQENQGLSGARNAGIEVATGVYLTFVDSDDLIQGDTYSANMEILLADRSIDLLEYPVYMNYGSSKQYIWKLPYESISVKNNLFPYWIAKQGYAHSYACNKIYKKELFDDICFPLGRFFEDLFTLPSIIRKVKHYCISDKGLYYYYQREGSITTNFSYEKYQDLMNANLSIWKEIYKESSIARNDLILYYLHIIDILIVLLSFEKQNDSYHDEIIQTLHLTPISISDLWKVDILFWRKCKNLTLMIFGVRIHCKIINRLIKRK